MFEKRQKNILITILLSLCIVSTIHGFPLLPEQTKDSILQLFRIATKQSSNNLNEATKTVDLAILMAESAHLTPQLFKAYRIKGYILEQNSRLLDALEAYNGALRLQNMVNDSAKMDIFIDWAIINKKLVNYKISQEYYTYALKIAEKQHDIQMVSYSYNGLATLHGAVGDFEKAINYYHQAIEALGQSGQKADLINPYRNIALVYSKANNPVLALKNAQISYKLALEVQDSTDIAGCLETLGIIYLTDGKANLALKNNLEALKIIEAVGDKRVLLDVLMQTADTYMQLNELDKAEVFYKRCLDYKDLFDYLVHPNFYNKLGNLYLKQGGKDAAKAAFEHSLELAKAKGFKDLIQKNNLSLAHIFEKNGDLVAAYHCLETARIYADSLFNEEKARNITQAQFMFDVERSEKKYKDLQLQQSRIWLVAAIMLFSIITLFLAYFLRQRGINNKALQAKNAETKLQNRRLEESNEILRQFAYASAHDLKEPLRSISSFTSIIKRRYVALLPPEAGDYMNFVVTGVKRMESLLSALLEYSTIIAEANVVSQPVLISSVLEDVTKNLHLIVNEKNATIAFPPTMGFIRMSRLHMTQLFQNLIGNALKFTDKPPEVVVACQTVNDEFLITIKDNGIGMNPDYGDKIFRLFQRLDKSYEGTGIGLTICKNIVEKYNGKIWFESAEGVGTTFFISLPLSLIQLTAQNTEGGSIVKKEFGLLSNTY